MQVTPQKRRVAVIGAGLSGLICATTLQNSGFNVTVFEKSRGVGGRMATRRVDTGLQFDHGAQYFTAYDSAFAKFVEAWTSLGVVAEWRGRIVEIRDDVVRPKTDQPHRYVGVPGMTAIARHLAEDILVHSEAMIARIDRDSGGWKVQDSQGRTSGTFDSIILSLPAPQSLALLRDHPLSETVRAVSMTPCWAAMLAFDQPVNIPWDGAFVHNSPLTWVARNSSKPGRDAATECWTLHASPDWSAARLDWSPDQILESLLTEFTSITSSSPATPSYQEAHRWLYSSTRQSPDRGALFDPGSSLGLCGDWLAGGRVEGAFRSGIAVARHLLQNAGMAEKLSF